MRASAAVRPHAPKIRIPERGSQEGIQHREESTEIAPAQVALDNETKGE